MNPGIKIKGFFKIMGMTSAVLLLLASVTPMAGAAGDVIKIGGTLPLSGVAAQDAESMLNGRKLAAEMYNEQGGVMGKKIEVVILDDGFQEERVASLYETLIRKEKADFFVPSVGAAMAYPAMTLMDKYDKIMISAFSSNEELIKRWGGKRWFAVFCVVPERGRANWLYPVYTDFLWDFDSWNHKPGFPKPKTIAILSENQLWGIENHASWKPRALEQGWDIVMDEFVEMDETEFSSIISKLKTIKPDVIQAEFFYFRHVLFAKQLYEQRVAANFVALSESGFRADWLDPKLGVGPKLANGIIAVKMVPDDYPEGGVGELRKRFKAKYNREPGFLEATGFADVQLIAQAVELAGGSTKPDDIRKALLTGTFKTAYTPVKFSEVGANTLYDPPVGQYINGKLEVIYPAHRATAKPIYPYRPGE
jgi:branched-chain amino acid transport system substrate-binding protein